MFEELKKEIDYCTFCPNMCRFVCPVTLGTGVETYVPTKKVQFMYFLLKGTYDLSDPDYNEVFYYCTTCTACTEYCDHDIDVSGMLRIAREKVVSNGVVPSDVVKIRDNCVGYGNPYGRRLKFKKEWEKFDVESAQVLLFPGYTAFFESPDLIDKFFNLAEKIGIDYVSLTKTPLSTGYPLYTLGFKEEFLSVAESVKNKINKYKLIVTLDPVDAYMLRVIYDEYGFKVSPEVLTLDEFLYDNIEKLKDKFSNKKLKAFSYHDPCYLGRYAQIYKQPREIASLFFEKNIENPWHHKDSFCCGRGGMFHLTHREESMDVAKTRLSHFNGLKIDGIVTSCPGGKVQLTDASNGKHEIFHILDLFLTGDDIGKK